MADVDIVVVGGGDGLDLLSLREVQGSLRSRGTTTSSHVSGRVTSALALLQ